MDRSCSRSTLTRTSCSDGTRGFDLTVSATFRKGEEMAIDRTDPYTRLNPRPVPTEDYTREETYRHTRAPVDLAVTLIPDAYSSREFFELEREKVFASCWIVVGFTS